MAAPSRTGASVAEGSTLASRARHSCVTPTNRAAWKDLHKRALEAARAAGKDTSKQDAALLIDTLGGHFPTDAFTSGHLFDKQKLEVEIDLWLAKNKVSPPNPEMADYYAVIGTNTTQLVLKNIHDRLNAEGIEVSNRRGMTWKAFGDDHLKSAPESLRIGAWAVFESRRQVMEANRAGPEAMRSNDVRSRGSVLAPIMKANIAAIADPGRENQLRQLEEEKRRREAGPLLATVHGLGLLTRSWLGRLLPQRWHRGHHESVQYPWVVTMTAGKPLAPLGEGSRNQVPGAGPTRLRLLGGFRVEQGDSVLAPPSGGQRLLAILGTRGAMSRTAAAGILWPDVPERHAQGSLRTTLWRLGRIHPQLVETAADRLDLASGIEVDLRSFTLSATRLINRTALEDCDDLDTSISMTGELLPGWYEDWVLYERERVRQLRLRALEALATHLCRRGSYAAAIDIALEAIQLEPLRESAHHTLITVHLHEENVIEAVRHFRSFSQLLRDELGVELSPRIAALISNQVPADFNWSVIRGSGDC